MNDTSQQANFFALFKKNPDCYYPGIRIDFTDVKDHSASVSQGKSVFKRIVPTFNNDRLHYTNSFIIEKDDPKPKQSTQKSNSEDCIEPTKEKFDQRIQKTISQMQIEEIYQPEPEGFFCQICRTTFEKYLEHIKGREHIRNSEFSKGHKYVKQICRTFKKYSKGMKDLQTVQESESTKKKKPICNKNMRGKLMKKTRKDQIQQNQIEEQNDSKVIKFRSIDQTDGFKSKKNDHLENIINQSANYPEESKLSLIIKQP